MKPKIFLTIAGIILNCMFASVIHIPDDYPTIQAGLDSTADYDTVFVHSGVYVENINWPDRNGIKLIGENKFDTIIDGNAQDRVITMLYQPYYESEPWDTTTVVKNLTIRNGQKANGAGIDIGNSGPIIEDLIVTENNGVTEWGSVGIGVRCFYSYPYLRNLDVFGNIRPNPDEGAMHVGPGVGINCDHSNVHIHNVHVHDNVAVSSQSGCEGIGIGIIWSTVEITSSLIENNYVQYPELTRTPVHGGGIAITTDSYVTLYQVVIQNNESVFGAGMSINDCEVQMNHVDIVNNTATGGGGGIDIENSSELQMSDVNIEGNSAGYGGGMKLAPSYSTHTIRIDANNTQIHSNSAQTGGGGVYYSYFSSSGDTLFMSGIDIVNNTAQTGGGVYINSDNATVTELSNLQITNNISSNGGGAIRYDYWMDSNYIINCTISDNLSLSPGGAGGIFLPGYYNESDLVDVTLINTILYNNEPKNIGTSTGLSGYFTVTIQYSDWVNNIGSQLDYIILNEDHNISEDPQFNIEDGIYLLSETSPCIDAGDPSFPFDPDGTFADIGARYFDQTFIYGDLNSDDEVNILDIVRAVTIILGDEPTPMELTTGDLDQDGILTVLDIIQIINIILEN